MKWAGSRTVAIPYDISEDNLMKLLPQINGILFTGGALDLISNSTGEPHPYYVTAKRIFEYSKFVKDVKEEEWPILGVCQGLELISILLGEDKISTLDYIDVYGQSLPIDWKVENVTEESRLFSTFPDYLVEAMDNEGLALHAHTYSVSVETFNSTPGLKEFMKIT
jgi:gamma-glutamyl hydrolase